MKVIAKYANMKSGIYPIPLKPARTVQLSLKKSILINPLIAFVMKGANSNLDEKQQK